MKQFNVEAVITEHFFVDANDMEDAFEVATDQISQGYDVMPSQVTITYAKEIK